MNISLSKMVKKPIEAFLNLEASSGIILAFCAVIAMALFISNLALSSELEIFSKTGIIFGSVIAGLVGSVILSIAFQGKHYNEA